MAGIIGVTLHVGLLFSPGFVNHCRHHRPAVMCVENRTVRPGVVNVPDVRRQVRRSQQPSALISIEP